MIFFSNLIGKKIRDNRDLAVATVADILIKTEAEKKFPVVLGLRLKTGKGEKKFVPAEKITGWEEKQLKLNATLAEAVTNEPAAENIIPLYGSVVDKQIVDLAGMRVVRVNDLEFGLLQNEMCLIAIDISTRGMLRRLGLKLKLFDQLFKSHLLEWQDMKLIDNKLHLPTGVEELVKLHPADIANIIEKMNVYQGSTLLQYLDPQTAAQVLEEIQPQIQKLLIKNLGSTRAAQVMGKMSVDELVDLIQLLPGREAQEIINQLPTDSKTQKVKKILEYDEDTAGGLMTTEYFSALPETTVAKVLEEIKKISNQHQSLHFIYITNSNGQFLGVASLRTLILAKGTQTMKEIMKKRHKMPTITVNQELMSVAALMTKYNLLSVAVLDKDHTLLGIVTADDIMQRLVPNA
ncbi:MAG: CBS domain-containing protein [Candidatus Komeilibacteria bacterium]|nr:CBS domain-containing protein [Candidatus Komeilibacteria bacterium]